MHVLVIGGTRFVGYQLVWRLLAAGHRVSTLNRGRRPDPFGDRVERLRGDRTTADFARLLTDRRFEATVDFAAYTAADAQGVVEVLGARAGHYVFISSGQVYLVRQGCPRPVREEDYEGPLLPQPEEPADRDEWRYGVEKRQAEDSLVAAWQAQGFPSTRLRLPMVNGERDHFRRIESYLWRLLDGGPLLIPESGPPRLRHVYSGDVVTVIAGLLGDERTFGEAYNVAQYAAPALVDLVTILADLLHVTPRLVAVTDAELQARQLAPALISPFSDRWMSDMHNGKAVVDLRFRPEPLRRYLDKMVTAFLNHFPTEPPPNYRNRAVELALAEEVTRVRPAMPAPPERDWRNAFDLEDALAERPPTTEKELNRVLVRHGIDTTTLAPLHSGADGTVYRLVVRGEQALDIWHALRAIVATTGHWPVLLGDEEWVLRHASNMELDGENGWGTAAQIITAAEAINVPAWLETQIDLVSEHYRPPHGSWPDEAAIREVIAKHNAWLHAPPDNELDILYQHGLNRLDFGSNDFRIPRGLVPLVYVALVPTRQSWQVPAYLKFGGWNEAPKPAEHVAVLKHWSQRHGTEVLAMKFDTV
ncbi:MAG: NAD-dependent epimerase/dehydratase family protein, partial [Chloroflexota bacterium]